MIKIKYSIHYITILWCTRSEGVYLSDIPLSKSVVWVCQYFHWRMKTAFCQEVSHKCPPMTQLVKGLNWTVSQGRDVIISMGKWTKCYDWPAALKCKKRLALAQPPVNDSWWQTLNLFLPPDMYRHRHEMTIPLFYFIYLLGSHNFIMGVTV